MRTHSIVLDTIMNITRGDYTHFNDRTYLEAYETIARDILDIYHDDWNIDSGGSWSRNFI